MHEEDQDHADCHSLIQAVTASLAFRGRVNYGRKPFLFPVAGR